MPTPNTRPTGADVTAFLDAVPDGRRRAEGHRMRELFERVTGVDAEMWGPSIVGFGARPATNTTGTSDWFVVGFSPRKPAFTFYGLLIDDASTDPVWDRLGPHTVGKGCLYVKRLDAVDPAALEDLVERAWERRDR